MIDCSYKILNKNLMINVSFSKADHDVLYGLYVYNQDKQIIVRKKYQNSNDFNINLENYGIVYLKIFVKAPPFFKESSRLFGPILLCDDAKKDEYETFLEDDNILLNFNTPFAKNKYPFQDILLTCVADDSSDMSIKKTMKTLDMHNTFVNDSDMHISLFTTILPIVSNGNIIAFSGMGKCCEELIFGMDDITDNIDISLMSDEIGEFSLFSSIKNTITIETDYFGVSKIYYYQNEGVFICTNRMHLLLITLKALNIQLIPNRKKIKSYLSIQNQLFMQNFTSEMNIKGVYVLPADSKIKVDFKDEIRINFEKTNLYRDLAVPEDYDINKYELLLNEAAKELCMNAEIIFKHKRFKNCIVHTTGGLDTRLVYCVLSKFPEYRHKIICHTAKMPNQENDFETAIEVFATHPFTFSRPDNTELEEEKKGEIEGLSYIIGTTSEFSGAGIPYKNIISLNGFFGEITARAYYTRNKTNFVSELSKLNNEDFFYELTKRKYLNPIFDAFNETKEELQKAIIELPGRTNLEKFENHYLFYRNALHCSSAHRTDFNWGILQSKTLMKLKYMLYPFENSIKLQLDIMYLLNPRIAGIRFASESDQIERERLNKIYNCYPTEVEKNSQAIIEAKEEWEKNDKNTFLIKVKLDKIFNIENALIALRMLMNRKILSYDEGMILYFYLKNDEKSRKRGVIIKLISLYFELSM